MTPESCPNCGAEVPPKARACPECGADESNGWSDAAHSDRLGLPDDNFDYNDFVKQEFGAEQKPRGINWFWWVIAIAVLLLFLFLILR
ncbi:MAG TPA: zinc ribbon domain-containing protein [Verrucomicrobiae bacterium]